MKTSLFGDVTTLKLGPLSLPLWRLGPSVLITHMQLFKNRILLE